MGGRLSGKNELGEGPVFDTVTGCLFWCDIIGRTVLAGDTQTGLIKTFGFGEPVSAVFLTDTDQLLVAGASGLYQLDPKTGTRDLILPIEKDNPITRANDSRVAPGNSIWFGTMGRKLETDAGAIYHVKDGRCTPCSVRYPSPTQPAFRQMAASVTIVIRRSRELCRWRLTQPQVSQLPRQACSLIYPLMG